MSDNSSIGSETNEPRRSSRAPKPKHTYAAEDFEPPVQRRRTEAGEAKKRAREEQRAQTNAEKLARKNEKERVALEKQQQKLQKQEEKLKRQQEKAELKAQRDRERQLKKLEQEKLKEQKKIARELKQKPKAAVNVPSLTKFMEQHGITATSSPEDFSKVLTVARKYHAMRNGNAVTISAPNRGKLTESQLTALKDLYTKPIKKLEVPDLVHAAQTTTVTPLSEDQVAERAQAALIVASAMFDSDSEVMDADLSGEDSDEGTDATEEDQDLDLVNLEPSVASVIEIPELPSLEDEEAAQLRREQSELESLVAIAKQKAELRKRNQELQEQLQSLLKQEKK